MRYTFIPVMLAISIAGGAGAAQRAAAAQNGQGTYHVTMVPRTILAINYQNRTKTEIGFQGSPLMPLAKGSATVDGKNGRIAIDARFENLEPATKFGPEYLTYVLWGITPEGKANNLGEVLLSGNKSKLLVTTTLQTFGLIVTAEPDYAVAEPSDVVVLENVVASGTVGTLQQVNVNYSLFKRGLYSYNVEAAAQRYPKSKVPLELEEARNAVEIARNAGAQQYAPDVLAKAELSLSNAEATKSDKKVIVQDSRDAVQNAAEALQMTMQRKEEEARAQERAAAAQRTAEAQAQAQAAAAQQQQAELQHKRSCRRSGMLRRASRRNCRRSRRRRRAQQQSCSRSRTPRQPRRRSRRHCKRNKPRSRRNLRSSSYARRCCSSSTASFPPRTRREA